MSDQQALMAAQQNPDLAQHVMQNPEIMPGAMAAASSGMNAPNVSPSMWSQAGARMQNPMMWQALGGIGGMVQRNHPQGALMAPLDAGRPMQQQQGMGRPQMGALYQARPSRIY